MNNKLIWLGLAAAGLVLVLISATADMTGIGAHPGFGWKQMIGAAIGIMDIITGLVLYKRIN